MREISKMLQTELDSQFLSREAFDVNVSCEMLTLIVHLCLRINQDIQLN